MKNKALITSLAIIAVLTMLFSSVYIAFAVPPPVPVILDSKTIPKYVNQLVAAIPWYRPTNIVNGVEQYTINMTYFREQILPPGTPLVGANPLGTQVWGYQGAVNLVGGGTLASFANSPSASFIATRGVPSNVTWVNNINVPQFLPVDPTIVWANPTGMATPVTPFTAFPPGYAAAQSPVPLVPHLHGGEISSFSDGGPNSWFTYNGLHGTTYSTNGAFVAPTDTSNNATYYYPNNANPTTIWYHDHAMGMTRLNVMSGLAGYYFLKDPPTAPIITPTAANLDQYLSQHFPYGVSEIPIAIQDRTFYTNGELWFPTVGINPTIHPYWFPEFFGNTIMVNGKVWPNLNVTQGWYRLHLLEGSNARFYTLSFSNKMPFTVIASDGGYLTAPVVVNSLTMAPGERYDVLVDFSAVPIGTKIIMQNTAKAPFPNGAAADPQTTGQIMQFTVQATSANPGATPPALPTALNPTLIGAFPTLAAPATQRVRTLFEVMGPAGPLMVTVNGQAFNGVVNDLPTNGTTEDWVIVNLTGDSHPIHTHLATFQLVSRQPFQAAKYTKDWLAINAAGGLPPFPDTYNPASLSPIPYLQGKPTPAKPTEMGWKDTVIMNPGEVTIIRIRFTQQDGTKYPFDPSQGPGYVWHCHIVDHEDNEMMRPYRVIL